jgi:hypothetical protein
MADMPRCKPFTKVETLCEWLASFHECFHERDFLKLSRIPKSNYPEREPLRDLLVRFPSIVRDSSAPKFVNGLPYALVISHISIYTELLSQYWWKGFVMYLSLKAQGFLAAFAMSDEA